MYALCILYTNRNNNGKKTTRKQNIRFDIVLKYMQVFLMNFEMEYYLNVFLRIS